MCLAPSCLTNNFASRVAISTVFLCVGVRLPVIYRLSFFTILLIWLTLVPLHWGFGLCVCLCPHPSERQSPALCGFHARLLSLHRRGAWFGTSWESECRVRWQFWTWGVAAAALLPLGACWGICLIRNKDQPVVRPAEQYLLGPPLVD